MPSWSSSSPVAGDDSWRLFASFPAGFRSVFCFGGGWSSPPSELESVVLWAFRATLFFAVGGPTRGLFFLAGRCWCTSSSPSSKLVARFRVVVLLSIVSDLLSADARAYKWVGSASSSASSARALNGEGFLLSSLGRFAAGLFADGGGGWSKSGRLETCLFDVLEEQDVPGWTRPPLHCLDGDVLLFLSVWAGYRWLHYRGICPTSFQFSAQSCVFGEWSQSGIDLQPVSLDGYAKRQSSCS